MNKNELGVDWSKYQGNSGVYPAQPVTFVIAQVGGINSNGLYNQAPYYDNQVANAKAKGMRVHTYIWYEVGGDQGKAKQVLDYTLPLVKTPKGSIVALDYESGASGSITANTDAILYGMRRVKEAGYTPMYYSYAPFTLQNVDYKRILKEFPQSLWIAGYGQNLVGELPNLSKLPALEGIAIWQFTSNFIAGGLDGNIDLTGITYVGYGGTAPSGNSNSNSNSTIEGLEDDDYMKFTYEVKNKAGKSGGQYYFNGQKIIGLQHADQAKIIRQIYKDTVGKDMKHYVWSESAPWHNRFMQANNITKIEMAGK